MTWFIVGQIFIFGIGSLSALLGIAHEISWLKKFLWFRTKGVIIGYERDDHRSDSGYHPRVRYTNAENKEIEFVSKYGDQTEGELNREVSVVYHPEKELAEVYSPVNRWLFTIVPILFGWIFIWTGIYMEPA